MRAGLRWLVPTGVYAVIIAASLVPGEDLAGTPAWVAVAGHGVQYAALGAALRHARPPGGTIVVLGLAVLLGLGNELQQGAVPGRSPDVFDLAVDALGALVGVALYATVQVRRLPGR